MAGAIDMVVSQSVRKRKGCCYMVGAGKNVLSAQLIHWDMFSYSVD